jgi:hypothetical protein
VTHYKRNASTDQAVEWDPENEQAAEQAVENILQDEIGSEVPIVSKDEAEKIREEYRRLLSK